jgi:DNA-binding CsgD family transcriptional regulator
LEALAALRLAIDLANGAPEGTALRGTLVALELAEDLGLSREVSGATAFAALFRYLGCTSYALEEARALGDEHEAARILAPLDKGDAAGIARALATSLGAEDPWHARVARGISLALNGEAFRSGYEASHCEAAVLLAERLGASPAVCEALAALHERWDGTGGPGKLRGEAIPLVTRIVQLAREVTVLTAVSATPPARTELLRLLDGRSGAQLDPALVAHVRGDGGARLQAALTVEPLWETLVPRLAAFASAWPVVGERLSEVFADFADAKCPIFLGHSRAVAALVTRARPEDATLQRAALLHDLGRVAIPNRIWMTPGPLDRISRSRVDLHAAIGARLLAHEGISDRSVARRIGAHHGGGGADAGTDLLHVADIAVALGEARPHRPAFTDAARIDLLRAGARDGTLPAAAVATLVPLLAGGSRPPPAILTAQERAVLALVARGLSNKEVANSLGISARTVQSHTIHAYDKLGIRTRAGAALRAMELGLLAP